MLLQLATPEFDARQVDYALVIRATTRSTYNATMLRDKLIKNVARINGPLMFFFHFFVTCSMVNSTQWSIGLPVVIKKAIQVVSCARILISVKWRLMAE